MYICFFPLHSTAAWRDLAGLEEGPKLWTVFYKLHDEACLSAAIIESQNTNRNKTWQNLSFSTFLEIQCLWFDRKTVPLPWSGRRSKPYSCNNIMCQFSGRIQHASTLGWGSTRPSHGMMDMGVGVLGSEPCHVALVHNQFPWSCEGSQPLGIWSGLNGLALIYQYYYPCLIDEKTEAQRDWVTSSKTHIKQLCDRTKAKY